MGLCMYKLSWGLAFPTDDTTRFDHINTELVSLETISYLRAVWVLLQQLPNGVIVLGGWQGADTSTNWVLVCIQNLQVQHAVQQCKKAIHPEIQPSKVGSQTSKRQITPYQKKAGQCQDWHAGLQSVQWNHKYKYYTHPDYTSVYLYIYIYMYVWMDGWMDVCMYVRTYVCTYVCFLHASKSYSAMPLASVVDPNRNTL